MEPHPVYRTLDDPVSILLGLEPDDIGVILGIFLFWNMTLGFLDRFHIISILSPLLLGILTVVTAWIWMRLKERMPRYFLRDFIRYIGIADAYDVGPDLEAGPYVISPGEEEGEWS